jgi:hypothetical protein
MLTAHNDRYGSTADIDAARWLRQLSSRQQTFERASAPSARRTSKY